MSEGPNEKSDLHMGQTTSSSLGDLGLGFRV